MREMGLVRQVKEIHDSIPFDRERCDLRRRTHGSFKVGARSGGHNERI